MNSLVSVIVPTYNRKDLLKQCLNAILSQTYRPIEVIVVDDGSTDDTDEYIRTTYGTAIKYVQCEHSGLPAIARNTGIDHSKGSYIAFCDSDDIWMPEKLTSQLRRMKTNGSNCSCSDAFIIHRTQETVLRDYNFRFSNRTMNLLRDNFIITSSVVIDRELLMQHRFPTSPAFRAYEDYVLWLSLFDTLKIDFIAEPLLYYRKELNNLSASVQTKDPVVQLKILFTQRAYRHYPAIAFSKLARLLMELGGLR